jgi:TonB family protein
VKLRGQIYQLPFDGDFKQGAEPEVVEVTAPGRQGRLFWITFDRPVTLAADLPQGQGVVEATKEQTLSALGEKPVGGAPAQGAPSDKSEVGGKPRAPAHESPGDKVAVERGSAPVDLASLNAKPKAVGVPDSHKSAAPAPSDRPEPPTPSKPAAAPAPSKPVAPVAALAPSKPPAPAVAPAPSKPAAQADVPAPPKPAVPAEAPAPPKPAVQAEAPAPSKPAAPAVAPAPSPAAPKAAASSPATTAAAEGGRIDRAKTEALVKSHLSEVQRCYKWGMDDPHTKGRVTLRIAVSETGAVMSAKVESSSLHSGPAESCIVDAVGRWKFPAPVGGPAVVVYPFDFH